MMLKEEMNQEIKDSEFPDPEYDGLRPIAGSVGVLSGLPTYDKATPEIYSRISKVMSEISAIGKDQQNRQQGFRYRGIDDIYNSLHTAMAKHCIFTTSRIIKRRRQERTTPKGAVLIYTALRICYRFYTVDGSFIETTVEGEGMDSGDKSSNKAMAVAHKYALLQIFMIPTEETKDPDAETHKVAPRQQANPPAQRVTKKDRQNINPAIVRDIGLCEDLQTLKEMWEKIPKEQHALYESTKNMRKDELSNKEADKDQEKL